VCIHYRSIVDRLNKLIDVHSIVVIPSFGATQPENWKAGSRPWLEQLVEDNGSVSQSWTYVYTIDSTERPWMQQLQQKSHDLVSDLKDFCKLGNSANDQRPLIFICHSLGGLLLKKALCVMKEHNLEDLDVVNVISGICFISTPHLRHDDEVDHNVFDSMIAAATNSSSPGNAARGTDNKEIIRICLDFESSLYRVPIVTICEGIDMRLPYKRTFAKLLRKSRMVRVVPAAISSIGKEREPGPMEVPRAQGQTCNIGTKEAAYAAISGCLARVLHDAPGLIESKFRRVVPVGLETGTLRSHRESPPKALTRAPTQLENLRQDSAVQDSDFTRVATAGTTERSYIDVAEVGIPASFEAARNEPKLPCFSVPAERNKNFFARDDIVKRIDAAFFPKAQTTESSSMVVGESTRSFALCDMGGIGKTSIALQYAYKCKDEEKFDAILWIKADEKENIELGFARIAIGLCLLEKKDTKELLIAVQTVKDWLSRPLVSHPTTDVPSREASWLLIFDNVNDFEALNNFWPGNFAGCVLITSRDPLAKNQVYTVHDGIDLKPFSHSESNDFIQSMTKILPQRGQENALDEVAVLLGGLPLLLTQMTGLMRRLRLSYSDFMRLVRTSGLGNIEAPEDKHLSEQNRYGMLSQIGFDKLTSGALRLLQVMAYLDPDKIPENLFDAEGSSDIQDSDFPTQAVTYFAVRGQLLQSSLIYLDEATQEVSLHRVVQTMALEKMNASDKLKCLDTTVSLVSKKWPFQNLRDRFNTSRYDDCAKIFSHVLRLRIVYEEISRHFRRSIMPNISAAALFNDAGW